MSRRRKRHHRGRPGGGRVTPRGGPTPRGSGPGAGQPRLGPLPAGVSPLDDPESGFLLGDPLLELIGGLEAASADGDPLQVDLWAAGLIGSLRAGLRPAMPWEVEGADDELGPPPWEGGDPPSEEEFFTTLVDGLVERTTGPSGRGVLAALQALAPYLPQDAAAVARSTLARDPRRLPPWAAVVGDVAVDEAFVVDHEADDGHNVALVARYPQSGRRWLVMVLVDVNLGGIAKDILVADIEALDDVRRQGGQPGFSLQPLELPVARARIEAALAMTDMTIDAPVADDLDETRPLLEVLLRTLPPAARPDERDPPDDDELRTLADRLATGALAFAGAGVDHDDLVSTAQLMVGYCAVWVGCDPLAWSPTRLGLFLMDHVPRKVAAPPEDLAPIPDHLRALVPVAHQLAGWSTRQLPDALEAIDEAEPVFHQMLAEPQLAGPARQLVMRAMAEGIDLEDPDAVSELVDRVNAMGGIDAFVQGADLSIPMPEPLDVSELPPQVRERVAAVDEVMCLVAVELADPEHLDLSRGLLVRLATEHPGELARGGVEGWGGGIPYAVCQVNKMLNAGWWSDLDITGTDIAAVAGPSQQTVSTRAKKVRELLDLDRWPPPAEVFRSDVRARYERLGRVIEEHMQGDESGRGER